MLTSVSPNTDIFLLTETWLEPMGAAAELDGYSCISVTRPYKRSGAARASGGLACYVREPLRRYVQQWKVSADSSLLWLKVDQKIGFEQDLYICLAYIWPEGASHYDLPIAIETFDTLLQDIAVVYAMKGHVLLSGDFNARTAALQDHVRKAEYEHLLENLDLFPPDLPENICESCSSDPIIKAFGKLARG